MSVSESSQPLAGMPAAEEVVKERPERKLDWAGLLRNQTFQLAIVLLAAIVFCFWPFFYQEVLKKWMDMEGYYAHGFLIPVCAAYLVWDKWDRIKNFEVKTTWWALIPMFGVLFLTYLGMRSILTTLLSGMLLAAIWLSVMVVGGWKWAKAMIAPVGFMILGLPVFDKIIDSTTGRLQELSASIAYHFLEIVGTHPLRENTTTIYVPNFTKQLDIAVACSGLKTTIAVCSAVIFFMLIARLSWWKNLIMALIAIPLSVAINGLRIGLIGIVANSIPNWASDGDHFKQMHDVSGYVALGICFVLLGWITRRLGYK